jgi:hypothetical protein
MVGKIKKEIIRVWLGNLFPNLYESLVCLDQAFFVVMNVWPLGDVPD